MRRVVGVVAIVLVVLATSGCLGRVVGVVAIVVVALVVMSSVALVATVNYMLSIPLDAMVRASNGRCCSDRINSQEGESEAP